MVADCLEHDSIFVHIFQQHLMKFTENSSESSLKKNVNYSSGSASQYKNRKMFNKHYLSQ
jgi:hypothetical protein